MLDEIIGSNLHRFGFIIRKMGKILDYIVKKGDGNYFCYTTNKVSLDTQDNDVLNYDDKPASSCSTSKIAESDLSRVHTVRINQRLIDSSRPIFRYFLDGSRHIYKVDDMAIGKKIFPILAGQIIVGCCERVDRDTFLPCGHIVPKIVISLPDDFDIDDEGEDFCKLYCDGINEELAQSKHLESAGIRIDKILLYATDRKSIYNSDKDNYKNRATAKIQSEMTDDEQRLVDSLCKQNKLDDEHYLLKDGSLQYNPSFSNFDKEDRTMQRENFRYVIGVSKSFDPELIPDFEGHRLSRTIAGLRPFERTKAYRYISEANGVQYAVWYLRLRKHDFRETNFSDIVKCEMVIINEDTQIETDLINTISANLIKEAYPVCFGNDTRWANHLYPIYLTETFCKSRYYNSDIILNLF